MSHFANLRIWNNLLEEFDFTSNYSIKSSNFHFKNYKISLDSQKFTTEENEFLKLFDNNSDFMLFEKIYNGSELVS